MKFFDWKLFLSKIQGTCEFVEVNNDLFQMQVYDSVQKCFVVYRGFYIDH